MSCATRNQVIRERVENTNQVLQYADESRKAEIHTDVCISVENKSFHAHRLILSCYSVYFRAMFQTEMKEKYVPTVTIEGVDETSLGSLIDFIYTGKITINEENVFNLLPASCYLQFDEVKQFCIDFLLNLNSVKACFKVLEMANSCQNNNLLHKTVQFMTKNFVEILSTNDFTSQKKQDLLDKLLLLKSNCFDARLVYDAMIGWVKHNESREHDFAELFQSLDLIKFSSSFLAKTISDEPLVIKNHLCSTLVMKTLAVKLQERVSCNQSKILNLGGWHTRSKVLVVYKNDKVYPALPQGIYAHCSLQLDDYVYCIGGWNELSPSNTVCRMKLFEANNMEWEILTSMNANRTWFGAAVYKNGIAVAGGLSGGIAVAGGLSDGIAVAGGLSNVTLQSAEFYIPSLNQWSELPPIKESRSAHELVACNGYLYCLGGYCKKCLSSVEMLCDVDGTWKPVRSMQTPRKEFAAVNCKNTIYAIGGENDQHEPMKSVEKYDCKLDKWMFVEKMKIERRGHSACVMQDKIYVVGGQNAKSEFVSEIECYDVENDDWSILENTNEKLYRHSIVAI